MKLAPAPSGAPRPLLECGERNLFSVSKIVQENLIHLPANGRI
jgi:hypothetical protein